MSIALVDFLKHSLSKYTNYTIDKTALGNISVVVVLLQVVLNRLLPAACFVIHSIGDK